VLDYKFFNNNIHRHINSSTHKLLNLKSPSCLQLAKLESRNGDISESLTEYNPIVTIDSIPLK